MTNSKGQRGDGGRQFISPRDVADTGLGSQRRVQEMCKNGTIEAVRFGSTWRIDRAKFNRQFGTNI